MHKTLPSLLVRQSNILVNICTKTRQISNNSALDITIRRFIEDEARYVLPERCVALQETPVAKILTKGAKTAKMEAGVLLPICIVEERPSILYTVRSSNLRSHRGEIRFVCIKSVARFFCLSLFWSKLPYIVLKFFSMFLSQDLLHASVKISCELWLRLG